MKTVIYAMLLLLICNTTYANNNDWIPYNTRLVPPQVIVPAVPSITYSTDFFIHRPYKLTYDWVPYYSTKTTVVERLGFMCKYKTVIQEPVIEWVYQPVWR